MLEDWEAGETLGSHAVSPPIRGVVDFIERHFAEPLAVADLAALCGLSLHRFVTVFRNQVGIPPHRFLCRTRIRQACRLLRDGVPAAAVAIDTGFCDQSHLSRQFKRHCGTTPHHFAQKYYQNQNEGPPCA